MNVPKLILKSKPILSTPWCFTSGIIVGGTINKVKYDFDLPIALSKC